ncbi:cytochrome b/b6 domain-containing protein [Caenimonas aquaedulcis]|uniref:Cytochrome b/b6 domain-containing protein n=1 Tax=Caenimonas aquaedulcis TaxID=2793270 RepID=A0A931H4X9_9BURK|nr:cytochrome b/b6 domain-containing protein [Caenimonas aquaedulcis]MBG9388716.1 cytochrome b/b6 domain-containing protein [Caenimonas aquaedulcis]
MPDEPLRSIRIWDLPTRLFHWALAVCVVALVVTGKIGGDAMPWHGRLGYATGALLLFRLAWGFVGGYWSRFAAFKPSPGAALRYLRHGGDARATVGHSPIGALSVYAFLLFLGLQVTSGLFSDDQADFTGPLNILVSNRTAKLLTSYHQVGQYILIVLALLHVAAIFYYRFRQGRDLTAAMIHGDKDLPFEVSASADDAKTRWKALGLFALCCVLMGFIVRLGTVAVG